MLGTMLRRVTNLDYLGVAISCDLTWLRHVKNFWNKARRTLGLPKRTLSPCSQNVKSIAYKMLVRPQLEYASEVWNPYTMKCIKKIEQIQRNSSRLIFHEYCRDTDASVLINCLNVISSIHVSSFNMQPCFANFITTLLTYVLHLIYSMLAISQAELITP